MAGSSRKYFHLMISFALIMNVEILVSSNELEPLVLIDYGDGLDFPICARRSTNANGNYKVLDFTKKNFPATLPSYYCPISKDKREKIYLSESPSTNCLIKTSAYGNCDEEVKPSIRLVKDNLGMIERCGVSPYSELYIIGYHICTLSEAEAKSSGSFKSLYRPVKKKYKIETGFMKELYRFCFEKPVNNLGSITYIEYRITSPTLLENDILKDERNFEHNFTDDSFDATYYNLKDLEENFKSSKRSHDFYTTNDTPDKRRPTSIAPPEDMPFRLMRKPFFHVLNSKPLDEQVKEEWNKIGIYIREKAIQQLGQVKIAVGTSTVKDENGKPKIVASHDSENYTIMWKLVYTEKGYFAMAIIFHDPNYGFQWQKPPVKLCQRNLCEEYGWINMIPDHLKQYMYCCESKVITKNYIGLKNAALPLRLRKNFKSLFHMSESECHVKNSQREPALVNIYNKVTRSNSLPVYARELTPSNKMVYSAPDNPDEENEYYCPPATEDAYYILETNQDGKYNGCLFPNPGEYPYCERPVQPVLIPKTLIPNFVKEGCLSGSEHSQSYHMTYQLCKYRSDFTVTFFQYPEPMYTACYNHDFRRTAYIEYRIFSPGLLKNPLLAEEWDFVEELKTDSYNIFQNDFEIMRDNYKIVVTDPVGFLMTKNFLVPPQDMAFRVWKRAVFHYINVKPMWPYWVDVWNSINQYLRDAAFQLSWEMEIKTGVLNEDDPLQYTIWWKLIHYKYERGIAIILHNVPLNTAVKRLCAPNLCEYYQWNGMIPNDKNGYVYCCNPEVVTNLLGLYAFQGVLDRNYASNIANEY